MAASFDLPRMCVPAVIVTKAPIRLYMDYCTFICRAILIPQKNPATPLDALRVVVGDQVVFEAPVILLQREYAAAFAQKNIGNAPDATVAATLQVLSCTGAEKWIKGKKWRLRERGILNPPLVFKRKIEVELKVGRYDMGNAMGQVRGAGQCWKGKGKPIELVYLVGRKVQDVC